MPDSVNIFVMPPTPEVLATRLRNRSRAEGSISEKTIQRRLTKARVEIENYDEYGYILVNDVLDQPWKSWKPSLRVSGFTGASLLGVPEGRHHRLLAIAERRRRGPRHGPGPASVEGVWCHGTGPHSLTEANLQEVRVWTSNKGSISNYRYVLVAARRARQLQSGSQPLVTPFGQGLPGCPGRAGCGPGGRSGQAQAARSTNPAVQHTFLR